MMTATESAPADGRPIRVESASELESLLDEHDRVLVDFYTVGCPKCNALEPVLGNVARATDAVVAMVNPRDDLSLIETYDIGSVPTLILFEDGEEVGRRTGFQGAESLVEWVEGPATHTST